MNITDQLAQALPSCLVCGHARPFHVWWADVPAAGVCVECCNIVRAYRASKEGEKWRMFDPTREPIQEGDEWSSDGGKNWGQYGRFYFGHTLSPSAYSGAIARRPIRAT